MHVLDLLAHDQMSDFEYLADELSANFCASTNSRLI
jgi:hypothetical protein